MLWSVFGLQFCSIIMSVAMIILDIDILGLDQEIQVNLGRKE